MTNRLIRPILGWYPRGKWSDDKDCPTLIGAAAVSEPDPFVPGRFQPTNYEGGLPSGHPTLWAEITPPTEAEFGADAVRYTGDD